MKEAAQEETLAAKGAGARDVSRVAALEHDLALSREIRKRLDGEVGRLEARIAVLASEIGHLRGVLSDRERYLQAIQRSLVWRAAQALRRLVGRAW